MANIYFFTQGCARNQGDSEIMAGLLNEAGFNIIDSPDDASLVIINSCIVKGPTESELFRKLKEFESKNRKIIVAGCASQAIPYRLKEYSLLGTYQINNIVEVVEETLNGNIVHSLVRQKDPRTDLPKIRRNPLVDIVAINSGCLGHCTFCITKLARGVLFSYDKDAIITKVNQSVKEGCKEIWLTSEDTGAYGKDIGLLLPDLLKDLTKIEGNFKIRLGMANPDHIGGFLDDIIKVFKSDKMFKFLHIPVQSGNNEILKKMQREYTIEEFIRIVNAFRREIPEITISTDIICGFPEETKEQFNDSVELIKEIMPDVLNISRFWPRPGTLAAKMPQLQGEEIKNRSTLLKQIFNNISFMRNEAWIGWRGKALIDEKNTDGTFNARNYAYRPIVVKGNYNIGDEVNLLIKKARPNFLFGEQIPDA